MHHIRYDVQIPEQTQDINNTLIGGRVKCSASINDGRRPLNVTPALPSPPPTCYSSLVPALSCCRLMFGNCVVVFRRRMIMSLPAGQKCLHAHASLSLPLSIFVSLSLSLCTLLYFKPTFSLSLAVHLTTPPA